MADRCPNCRRTAYRGTTREVRPDECALEDGASCRAYRHGVDVGRAEADRLGHSVLEVVGRYPAHTIEALAANSRARGDEILPRLLDAIAEVRR